MIEYLRREEVASRGRQIQVPSWRPDLRVMADIAEEVAPLLRVQQHRNHAHARRDRRAGGYSDDRDAGESRPALRQEALGYSEIITYSFVSPVLV